MSGTDTATAEREQSGPQSLTELLDEWTENTDGDQVSLGELLDATEGRSHGPLLLVPAIIAMIPVIGAIPGMSIVTGGILGLLAVQMLFRSDKPPWLPKKLTGMKFGRDKLCKGAEKARPWTQRIDKLLKPRLQFFIDNGADKAIALAVLFLAATFYPLALVPWGVTLPGLACILFATALTLKDGLLALLGWIVTLGSAWFVYYIVW